MNLSKQIENPGSYKYHCPIDISGTKTDLLIKLYKQMLLIRIFEQKLAEGKKNGLIGGPVHLGVGQEAVAVGISTNLNKNDTVFGNHRSHSHLLALGSSTKAVFSEILGKVSGLCKGRGGSMHLIDKNNGFYGSVPIMAATIPLAVGAGLAHKLNKKTNISVTYFGDGAVEEGVFHESLNLASNYKLPVLFVVENNFFASHMHINQRQPFNSISRFASANNIPYKIVDGNDVIAIKNNAGKLIKSIRAKKGPVLIELITFRWYGHVDWRDDIDVGVGRSKTELTKWKKRDPVARLEKAMIKHGILNNSEIKRTNNKIRAKIQRDWLNANQEKMPKKSELLKYVYNK